MKRIGILLAAGLFVLNSACSPKRKPTVVRAPTPRPLVLPPPRPLPPAPAIVEPSGPAMNAALQPIATPPASPVPSLTDAGIPDIPPPRRAAQPKPVPPKPPPAPSLPAPQLGLGLSVEQRAQLESAYQSDVNAARAILASFEGRRLDAAAAETANRARAFLQQAEESHERDLVTAAQLARRASVMAQDLAKTVR